MKQLLAAFVVVAITGLTACSPGGSEDPVNADASVPDAMSLPDVADQLIEDGRMLAGLLSDVNSPETAQALAPEMDALVARYRLIMERFEAAGEPSFSDLAALASRAPQVAQVQQTVLQQIDRIRTEHPEAATVLQDTLEGLGRNQP